MPPGRQPLVIPRLSQNIINKAEHCARLIWFGTSYLTGKPQTSDELLLQEFSRPVKDLLTGQSNSVAFSRSAIHDLMVVGGLKALFRSQHQIDFRQFEHFLEANLPSILNTSRLAPPSSDLAEFVKLSGKALVNSNVKTNAGYRVALASRILFFAVPQLRLYNYSQDISAALQLPTRPQAAIFNFQEIFDAGLHTNWSSLVSLQAPKSAELNSKLVYTDNLISSDWWQRRVLDLAVRLHFNTVTPINPLPPKPRL